MPPEPIGLAAYQASFAARIRDPRAPLPRGAPARRMRVYQELLFNNLEGFLLACYPVTRKILGQRAWRRLVRRFFAEHRCHSPLFRDIPQAFLDWARGDADAVNADRPFLTDLLHYEWLELAVSLDPGRVEPGQVDAQGDLLAGIPMLHPSAQLASYPWPVHCIGPRVQPAVPDASAHHYLLFRDTRDAVRFIYLTPLSAALLALLQAQPAPGHQLLDQLAELGAVQQREAFVRSGAELLEQLRQQGAILGTRSEA